MARTLVAASSNRYATSSTPVTGVPFTVACWYKPATVTANQVLFNIGVAGSSANMHEIYFGTTSKNLFANSQTGSVGQSSSGTNTITTAGTWYHCAGVYTSTTSRLAYVNGTAGTADTTSVTPAGLDACYIGVQRFSGSFAGYCNGDLAEVALYSAALTDAEVASLAAGYSPLLVRPQSLVGYWPLFARATNEEDWTGGRAGTPNGTPAAADHPPRIIYPSRPRIIIPAAAGGTTVARLVNGGLVNGGTLIGGRLARMAA